ncbi:MAG: response regulator transcription factor [Chloroflexi bacterium]|nr:response regulator transcription factor [Chloroflexota bacterium]
MTSIVLVDDHAVVLHGLRALLEAEADFSIVGEAANGQEAIKRVKDHEPDILITDIMMAEMNGIELTEQALRDCPKTGVVILSMYSNDGYVDRALKAGARAYILKGSSSEELVKAIREAAAGRRYVSAPLSIKGLEDYAQKFQGSTDAYDALTRREREVLYLVAQGRTSTEIAEHFGISPRTIESHRASMMRKLRLANQTELFRFALSRGIVTREPDERD